MITTVRRLNDTQILDNKHIDEGNYLLGYVLLRAVFPSCNNKFKDALNLCTEYMLRLMHFNIVS